MNSEKLSLPSRVIYRLIQVLLPIFVILTSVRLVLYTADTWVKIEYRLPGFPKDLYGFSLDDRIYWSSIDIDYLLTDAEIMYFDEFTLADGSPMHNDRELSHMQDVKDLLSTVWKVWGSGIFVLLSLAALLWWMDGRAISLRAVIAGAKLTILLMIMLVIFLLAAFGVLFVGFHRIFFEGSTWLFPLSDTFIRLYPERFWRDIFALLAGVTVLLSGLVGGVARWLLRAK
ncbi:MAG TPA: TIGR01906 family membrane protein [Anaerolineales bacterium]|nr:TIGR01906 family membrane protein [Anaerolineales bacterium]HUS84437.1 TIGR01906 family membrane protein [Anaerolineales bacterium]